MFKFWKTELNVDDAKMEAYRLGKIMSNVKDKSSIVIPFDILEYIAKKSSLEANELVKLYIDGLMEESYKSNKQKQNLELMK